MLTQKNTFNQWLFYSESLSLQAELNETKRNDICFIKNYAESVILLVF
jgi:hypothetical protein